LTKNLFIGKIYQDNIRLSSNNFTVKIKSNVMAITGVTSTFNSTYEGVIGLSPPNTDEQN